MTPDEELKILRADWAALVAQVTGAESRRAGDLRRGETFTNSGDEVNDDITRLRTLAQAATPGPWRTGFMLSFGFGWYEDKNFVTSADGSMQIAGTGAEDDGGIDRPADAAYIAAASPDVVLALLEERDALLASAPKWIPCSERMPDAEIEVLAFIGPEMYLAEYEPDGWYAVWTFAPLDGVTHWMPLPAEPEETK
jgi:hypothetical protein